MWQGILEKHVFFQKITSISSQYKEIQKQSFQLSSPSSSTSTLISLRISLLWSVFGLLWSPVWTVSSFSFIFFILTALSYTIDISINISSPFCTKGDLFGHSSLTSPVMRAPYRKTYRIYRDNSCETCPTMEGASFPVNSVFP